jgi:hypothetical protein
MESAIDSNLKRAGLCRLMLAQLLERDVIKLNCLPLWRGAAIGQGGAGEERCMTHIGPIPL